MTVRNIASICNMVSADGGRAARQPLRGPPGGAAPGAQPDARLRPLPRRRGSRAGCAGKRLGWSWPTESDDVPRSFPGAARAWAGEGRRCRTGARPPRSGSDPGRGALQTEPWPALPPPVLPPALIAPRKDQSWVLNPH